MTFAKTYRDMRSCRHAELRPEQYPPDHVEADARRRAKLKAGAGAHGPTLLLVGGLGALLLCVVGAAIALMVWL